MAYLNAIIETNSNRSGVWKLALLTLSATCLLTATPGWTGILPPSEPEAGHAPAPKTEAPNRKFTFVHLSDVHVETFTSMPQDLATARSFPCVSTFGKID